MKKTISSIITRCCITLCVLTTSLNAAMEYPTGQEFFGNTDTITEMKRNLKFILSLSPKTLDIEPDVLENIPESFSKTYRQLIVGHAALVEQALDELSPRLFLEFKDALLGDLAKRLIAQIPSNAMAQNIAIMSFIQFHRACKLPIEAQHIMSLLDKSMNREVQEYERDLKTSQLILITQLLKKDNNFSTAQRFEDISQKLIAFEQRNSTLARSYTVQATAYKLLHEHHEGLSSSLAYVQSMLEKSDDQVQHATKELLIHSHKLYMQLLQSNYKTATYAKALVQ